MKTARLITTLKCNRNCAGCCNTYQSIMANAQHVRDLSILKDYDVVCLTGGEPSLFMDETIAIAKYVRRMKQDVTIYLYTACYNRDLIHLMSLIDGIQYSLHAEATREDVQEFQYFQEFISVERNKSFRLFVDAKIKYPVTIKPFLWKRIEIKKWLTEAELLALQPNGLPARETLFINEAYIK